MLSRELLKQNNEKAFNSVEVSIPTNELKTFLDAKFWPSDLVHRERQKITKIKEFKIEWCTNTK